MASPTAVILAGGQSRRMGRDKAMEPVGGIPMLHRVVSAAGELTSDIVVVEAFGQRRPDTFLDTLVRRVQDRLPDRGPLAGLEAGLTAARAPYAWVLACDMPFLEPAILARLMVIAEGWDAVVPVVGGRPQPLCAVYGTHGVSAMSPLLDAGDASLHRLLSGLRVTYLVEEDLGAGTFENVNAPEDLGRAQERLRSGQRAPQDREDISA